jgi:hypothetical protein
MYYIETQANYASWKPYRTVEHMFATLGNGVRLNNKGFITPLKASPEFTLGEPQPYSWIYPWSDDEKFQPFRKLAGCRDSGFKQAAQLFIDCIKITDDSCENIKAWKDNLHTVEDVLLNTPTIQDEFTINDMDKFLEQIKNEPTTNNDTVNLSQNIESTSIKKVFFFDVQWSDCPRSVKEEVKHIWRDHDLGNDTYIYKTTLDEDLFEQYPRVYFWLKFNKVKEGENVIIHWWW